MSTSERLLDLIKNQGITPYFLSEKSEISQATISRILSGKVKKLSIKTAKILADYFKVDEMWLMTGLGSQEINNIEDMKEYSEVKKNMIAYLTSKRISKYEFYQVTGVSNGTLSNTMGVSEDILQKFINTFVDVNPAWLLTGKGNMTLSYSDTEEKPLVLNESNASYNDDDAKKIIEENNHLKNTNELQQELIIMLREKVEHYKAEVIKCCSGKKEVAEIKNNR